MGANRKLAQIFLELAAAQSLLHEDSFRASSNSRVARTLASLSEDLAQTLKGRNNAARRHYLLTLPGIGKGSARRILEFLETGQVSEHRELLATIPKGLFALLEIPGLGPQTVRTLWQELGITSVDDLQHALDSPDLAKAPGLGRQSLDNLRQSLDFSSRTQAQVPIGRALPIARGIVRELLRIDGVSRADVAGSLRRGRDLVGDIDLVVACADPGRVRGTFLSLDAVDQVLSDGITRVSVRLEAEGTELQADLRLVADEEYGAALLYFTGPKDHNVRLRGLAKQRACLLNEYGLFEVSESDATELGSRVAGTSEEEIYRALGLPFLPPELREASESLHAPETMGRLIEARDIRAELHAHTVASDGRLSIRQLARIAADRGYHTLAVTDHSQSSVLANGLDPERLRAHIQAVQQVNEEFDTLRLLAGSEVDILPNGRLDYEDDLLAELDIVVASPHASLQQSAKVATDRLVAAASSPHVDILGHPTGRLVGRRRGLEPDLETVLAAARESHTAVELNANPRRLDLRDSHLRAALDHGCRIAINTDAHSPRHFDFLPFGILTARRAGLTREECLNCMAAEDLDEWLGLDRRPT